MNFINFPESNLPLGAGPGNENTVPMRVMVCTHPGYKTDPTFYAGKFELDDQEKAMIREAIDRSMLKANTPLTSEQLDTIVNSLPPLWITSMHSWCPLILSVAHPFDMGYVKKQLNRPIDN